MINTNLQKKTTNNNITAVIHNRIANSGLKSTALDPLMLGRPCVLAICGIRNTNFGIRKAHV